mgnify:CR=1 FL=1
MAARRLEDERYAYFAEASVVFLDLPDAVFRGYEGDEQLLGAPREDETAPFEILRAEIARLEPEVRREPVLALAAISEEVAADAIEKIVVEWEPLPFVVDPVLSLRPGSPNARLEGNVWMRPPAGPPSNPPCLTAPTARSTRPRR